MHRRTLHVALLAALAATSCSTTSTATATPPPADAAPATSTTVEPAVAVLFGEDQIRDLRNLQLAINIHVDEQVQACMTAQGHDYPGQPLVALKEAGFATLTPAETTELAAYNDAQPIAAHVDQLPPEEQTAYWDALDTCIIDESIDNPLGAEDTWYADASERAAEQTAADPRLIDAQADTDQCLAEAGYGDLAAAIDAIDADTQRAAQAGQVDRVDQLTTDRDALLNVLAACDEARLTVEAQVFNEHFQAIAADEDLEAAEWAAAIDTELQAYAEQLAYLAAGDN